MWSDYPGMNELPLRDIGKIDRCSIVTRDEEEQNVSMIRGMYFQLSGVMYDFCSFVMSYEVLDIICC